MRAFVVFICCLLFMYVDFLFAEFSPLFINNFDIYIVPRMLFMFILLISVYISPQISSFFAILFGLMLDVYTGLIYGVHTFGIVAFVFFMHTAFRVFYKDFVAMAFVVLLLSFLYDAYIYLIHMVLGLIDMPVFDYFSLRAVPSLLLNAIVFTLVFIVSLKVSKVRKNVLRKH